MNKIRQERMANEMKRGISRIILEGIKDPRIDSGAVSITRIDVSGDLSHARVNFSILGDENKQQGTMLALNNAKGYIRTELSQSIKVRQFPELDFILDKSIEHGIRISEILKELDTDKNEQDNDE